MFTKYYHWVGYACVHLDQLILYSVLASHEGKEGKQNKPRRYCKNNHICNKATQVLRFSLLKGLSSENDIEGYFMEKSVLISKIWLKIS